MIELSYVGLALSLLLLVVPAVVLWVYDRNLLARGVGAVLRMLVQLTAGTLITYVVYMTDRVPFTLLWVVLMSVAGALLAVRRGRLPFTIGLSVCLSLLLSVMLVAFWFLLVVARVAHPFSASSLVPVTALLLAHASSSVPRGVEAWVRIRQTDRAQYDFLRGNGASHLNALRPTITKVLQCALLPSLANMRQTGLFALPLLFAALLLAGTQPMTALMFTVSMSVGCMVCSVVALLLMMWLSDKLLK